MSYQTEADRLKDDLAKSVNEAVSSGAKFLDPSTSGSYTYEDEYMANIQEAFSLLLKVKKLIG